MKKNIYIKTTSTLVITILLVFFVFSSCKQHDIVSSTYKTLKTMAVVYDSSMKSAAEMYKKGYLSDENKNRIITAARKYTSAHKTALTALITYEKTRTAEDGKKLASAIDELVRFFNEFETIAKPFVHEENTMKDRHASLLIQY